MLIYFFLSFQLPLLTTDGRELKVGPSRRRGLDRDSGSSTPDGEDLGHSESSQSDSGRGGHQRYTNV